MDLNLFVFGTVERLEHVANVRRVEDMLEILYVLNSNTFRTCREC